MNGKAGETKGTLIASCLLLLTAGGMVAGAYYAVEGFVTLGLEGWLKAALFFGVAALAFATAMWSWRRLRRYRPENGTTEQLRSGFSDDRSARAKFKSTRFVRDVLMLLGGILVLLFYGAFPCTSPLLLREGVQFLVMSGALAVPLGYMGLKLHRTLASYVPDEEPATRAVEARPPRRLRILVAVLLLLLAGAGALLLAIRALLILVLVWQNPSLGTFDVMLGNALFMAAGLVCLYVALASLQSGWWRRRQHRPQQPESLVGPVTDMGHQDNYFADRERNCLKEETRC